MLSNALEKAIDRAFRSAQSAHHEFLTLEHLLLALLDEAAPDKSRKPRKTRKKKAKKVKTPTNRRRCNPML